MGRREAAVIRDAPSAGSPTSPTGAMWWCNAPHDRWHRGHLPKDLAGTQGVKERRTPIRQSPRGAMNRGSPRIIGSSRVWRFGDRHSLFAHCDTTHSQSRQSILKRKMDHSSFERPAPFIPKNQWAQGCSVSQWFQRPGLAVELRIPGSRKDPSAQPQGHRLPGGKSSQICEPVEEIAGPCGDECLRDFLAG